jgi:hypothetical protein
MVTYVIIGFNRKIDLSVSTVVDKVYAIIPPNVEYDNEIGDVLEVVNDKNALELYQEKNFETLDEAVIFIDCRGMNKTFYDVMYFLNTARFDKRTYYVHDNVKNLNLAEYPIKEHFNPWTGEEMNMKLLSDLEIKHIKEMFISIGLITSSYLKAGFHESKINSIPAGWMMNFATPELQHLILYYGLKPKAVDINHNVEYLHNCQFREIVTKTLVHVLANHLVRNKYINTSQTENWFEYLKNYEF